MKNNNDIKLWDYHQTDNAKHMIPGHIRQEKLCNKIRKLLKKGKVLEIGFGDGYLLSLLSEQGYSCYGADISIENINLVKTNIKNVKYNLIGTDGSMPYKENEFDVYIASEVLEHMSDSEMVLAINEIYRVLKPGAYALVTIPAEENLKLSECFCPKCSLKFHKWGHKQYWDRKIIRERFKNFEIVEIIEYFNRYVGNTGFENFMGKIMQVIQTALNYIVKFPNKIYRNRVYIITLRKNS